MKEDPSRWMDDPELPLEMRADLETASKETGVRYDERAGLARLQTAIALGTAATGAASVAEAASSSAVASGTAASGTAASGTAVSAAASGTAAAASSGLSLKAAFWGLAAVGVASATIGVVTIADREPAPSESVQAQVAPADPPSFDVESQKPIPVTIDSPDQAEDISGEVDESDGDIDPAVQPAPDALSDAKPSDAKPSDAKPTTATPNDAVSSSDASVSAEMAHMAELRAAASQNPARAVAMADEGHAKFARGVFWQEREAIAIMALRKSGRAADAQARTASFLEQFPHSPFAEQLQAQR